MSRIRGKRIKPLVLSPSRIAEWSTCRRRYALKYIEGLEPDVDSPRLVTGSAVHAGLSVKVTARDVQLALSAAASIVEGSRLELQDKLDCIARASAVVRSWEPRQSFEVESVEERLDVKVPRGQRLSVRGVVDIVAFLSGKLFVIDHKVSSRQMTAEHAALDLQLLGYYAMLRRMKKPIVGSAWSSIVLPGTKRHIDESSEDYEKRLVGLFLGDPERYFQFYPLLYTDDQAEYWWELCRQVGKEVRAGKIYRNPAACRYVGCAYRQVCLSSGHALVMGFVQGGKDDESESSDESNGS